MPKRFRTKKKLERWLVRRCLSGGLFLTRLFPLKAIGALSRAMADVGYYVLGRNRQLALANLSLVYRNSKSPRQIRLMAREVFRFGSRCAFEIMFYYGRGHLEEIYELVKETEGLEHLDKAWQKGRGVTGLCAHLGNFVLLGGAINSLGYPCATIMRQMRDQQLEEMFINVRRRMRQIAIPKFPISRSVRESLNWLSQGNILAMYIDQRSETGATVDFLGLPTSTATGTAFFALKSKAPVLPMFLLRRQDGYYRLLIGPEVEVVETGNLKADTVTNTARFAKIIEGYVRQYPTQWFWFDSRLKRLHKPRG